MFDKVYFHYTENLTDFGTALGDSVSLSPNPQTGAFPHHLSSNIFLKCGKVCRLWQNFSSNSLPGLCEAILIKGIFAQAKRASLIMLDRFIDINYCIFGLME